jgi:hypothetical protein
MEMIELTEELIESAEQRSAGQPYPQFVKNLKAIGVDNYEVKVKNRKRTYTSVNGDKLIIAGDLPDFECAEAFELEAVKTAIKTHPGRHNRLPDVPARDRRRGHTHIRSRPHRHEGDLPGTQFRI